MPEEPHERTSADLGPDEARGPHLWLNWQALRVGQPARSTSYDETIVLHPLWEEHALYSDADVSGELELGPYRVMTIHSRPTARVGAAAQKLLLRHVDHLLAAPPGVDDTDDLDVSGWTGGTLGDQMAALLSLALARRVRCGGVVRQGFSFDDPLGRPTHVLHRSPLMAEPAYEPMIPGIADRANLHDAVDLLKRYSLMCGADAAALTRAAGQFADALWWADADPRIAWLKLVGALEAAANRANMRANEPVAQLKRLRGPLYGRLKKICPDAVPVVAQALAGTMAPEAKLLDFTLEHAPGPPDVRPQGGRVDFGNLEPALIVLW